MCDGMTDLKIILILHMSKYVHIKLLLRKFKGPGMEIFFIKSTQIKYWKKLLLQSFLLLLVLDLQLLKIYAIF